MELFDIIVILIIVWSAIVGWRKGLSWQLAAIVALAASAIVATRYARLVAPLFDVQPPWNHTLAVLVLFLITSLAVNLFFGMIENFMEKLKLENFNQQLGAIFGAIKGVIWCMLITFFLVMLTVTGRDMVLRSMSGKALVTLISQVDEALPEDLREALKAHTDRFYEQLNEGLDRTPDEEPSG